MSESRLTYVRFSHFRDYIKEGKYVQRVPYDVYKCVCGNEKAIQRHKVNAGRTLSCGCLNREIHSKRMKSELMAQYRVVGGNEGNKYGGGGKKGSKAHNKGKVFIPDYPNKRHSTGRFMKREEADALYYGIEGEVNSLKDQRWKQGDYR